MKKSITIELPEELARKLRSLDASSIQHVVEEGLKTYEEESSKRTLRDYLPYMQADDILDATRKAKEETQTLLEDQGLAVIALMLSDALADILHRSREDTGYVSEYVEEMAVA
ncbi:MAG: hypothetical protein H8D78_12325 [Chloroflexi bacterium]|nr:hypothetical protein [Chloroflexota bacterium]